MDCLPREPAAYPAAEGTSVLVEGSSSLSGSKENRAAPSHGLLLRELSAPATSRSFGGSRRSRAGGGKRAIREEWKCPKGSSQERCCCLPRAGTGQGGPEPPCSRAGAGRRRLPAAGAGSCCPGPGRGLKEARGRQPTPAAVGAWLPPTARGCLPGGQATHPPT